MILVKLESAARTTITVGRFRSWADANAFADGEARRLDGAVAGRVYAVSDRTGYVGADHALYLDSDPIPPRMHGGYVCQPAFITAEGAAALDGLNPDKLSEWIGSDLTTPTHERLSLTMPELKRGDWILTTGAGGGSAFVWWATDTNLLITRSGHYASTPQAIGDYSRIGQPEPRFDVMRRIPQPAPAL